MTKYPRVMLKQKHLPILFVALSSFFYGIFMSMRFPCHFRLMEGDSLFLFTREFFVSKLSDAPCLSNWLSDFLLQFYRWPLVGAFIEAFLVAGALLCLLRLLAKRGVKPLFLLPLGIVPLVLVFHHCDPRVLLQVFFFAVFLTVSSYGSRRVRVILTVLMLPLGILFMSTPLLLLLFFLLAAWEFGKGLSFFASARRACLPLVLAVIVPFAQRIYSEQVSFIPFDKRCSWGGNPFRTWNTYDEQCYSYAEMADRQEWEPLLALLKKRGKDDESVRRLYALMAERALGTLPENLFAYSISDPEKFLIRHSETPFARLFDRQFYASLGLYDEAMHLAMEYSISQTDGSCFSALRNMAQYSLRESDFPVAEKYLSILEHSLFHHRFVEEQRAEMARLKQEGVSPTAPVRADNFVGGYPFCSEMIRQVQREPQNQGFLDYLLCGLLLQKKLSEFSVVMHAFPLYKDRPLPKAYAEAAAVLESEGHTMRDVFQYPAELDTQYREFRAEAGKDGARPVRYLHTFWDYLLFVDTSSQASQQGPTQAKGHF